MEPRGTTTASVLLVGGASGVGKSTVIRDVLPTLNDVFLLEKDVVLESFLHSNPLGLNEEPDRRVPFDSSEYRLGLRDQVYASMFDVGFANALLGKSTLLDANYVGWLREPHGRFSLARRLAGLPSLTVGVAERVRLGILFFYVTDASVVRKRMSRRLLMDAAARDRDATKVASDASWASHVAGEPVTLLPSLALYADVLAVDLTAEYVGARREEVRGLVRSFLVGGRPLAETGLLRGESLAATLARHRV